MSQASHNPYNYLAPIQDPKAFFGRGEQLRAVCEGVAQRKSISFVGAPRCGLSSLLNRLVALPFHAECEALAGPLQFIHVDCKQFDDPLPLLRYLLAQVAPGRPVPGVPNWRLLPRLFRSALDRMQGKRVVILFDDFEHIGRSKLFVEFIDHLRGVAIEVNMSLITATHELLYKVCHKDIASSPFPNIFAVKKVGPFTQVECAQFLRATSATSGIALAPYAEQILKLGGRWPYCSHYYQAVAGGAKPDHEAIAMRFVSEAMPHFGHIWQGLEAGEKSILRDLASGEYPPDHRLDDLAEKGYILIEDKAPKMFSEAFGRFVRDSG